MRAHITIMIVSILLSYSIIIGCSSSSVSRPILNMIPDLFSVIAEFCPSQDLFALARVCKSSFFGVKTGIRNRIIIINDNDRRTTHCDRTRFDLLLLDMLNPADRMRELSEEWLNTPDKRGAILAQNHFVFIGVTQKKTKSDDESQKQKREDENQHIHNSMPDIMIQSVSTLDDQSLAWVEEGRCEGWLIERSWIGDFALHYRAKNLQNGDKEEKEYHQRIDEINGQPSSRCVMINPLLYYVETQEDCSIDVIQFDPFTGQFKIKSTLFISSEISQDHWHWNPLLMDDHNGEDPNLQIVFSSDRMRSDVFVLEFPDPRKYELSNENENDNDGSETTKKNVIRPVYCMPEGRDFLLKQISHDGRIIIIWSAKSIADRIIDEDRMPVLDQMITVVEVTRYAHVVNDDDDDDSEDDDYNHRHYSHYRWIKKFDIPVSFTVCGIDFTKDNTKAVLYRPEWSAVLLSLDSGAMMNFLPLCNEGASPSAIMRYPVKWLNHRLFVLNSYSENDGYYVRDVMDPQNDLMVGSKKQQRRYDDNHTDNEFRIEPGSKMNLETLLKMYPDFKVVDYQNTIIVNNRLVIRFNSM